MFNIVLENLNVVGVWYTYDQIILTGMDWLLCAFHNFSDHLFLIIREPGYWYQQPSLSGVPDFFDRNKIFSGYDLSHYQVPHCIRVFFYFVWFVFIHHNFQFYFKLCTYCNILDINLS